MVCQDTKVVQFFADFCNVSGQLWYLFSSGKRAIIINKKQRNKTKKNEEEKSMRLWKKVSAMVAMAAVCMTMAVPVTASAAEVDARVGGCPGGCVWELDIKKVVTDSEVHEHNGEYLCRIDYITIYYFKYCNGCGINQGYTHEYDTEHVRLS